MCICRDQCWQTAMVPSHFFLVICQGEEVEIPKEAGRVTQKMGEFGTGGDDHPVLPTNTSIMIICLNDPIRTTVELGILPEKCFS